jgi:hypothetical protein
LTTWIILAQPFTVSPVTQPWKSFRDKDLGFALNYPNSGWHVRIERRKSTVYFNDSSRTAQVNIAVVKAGNSNLAQYLMQQAKQLEMTATKAGAPVLFAGASWLQQQGNVQQSGATYRATIYATVHKNRLFTIIQMAPVNNYADYDKVIFSSMRSSWQFV